MSETPNVERIPLTPSMIAALRAESNPALYLLGFCIFALPALVIGAIGNAIFGALIFCGGLAVVVAAVYLLLARRPTNEDIAEGVFARSRGVIGVVRYNEGTDNIVTPDGRSITVDLDVIKALAAMTTRKGEIDYAPRADVIFEIRDANGAVVWRHKKLKS